MPARDEERSLIPETVARFEGLTAADEQAAFRHFAFGH
jgi:putative heme iron utilization protein